MRRVHYRDFLSKRSLCYRPGFTLVELVVVLSIITLLLGLILAAIQRVRNAAALAKCQNQLRQIGLGLQQYHDARRHFPAGVAYYRPELTNFDKLTATMPWHVKLLPYIGHEPLWEQTALAWKQDAYYILDPPHSGKRTIISTYICPIESRTTRPFFGEALTSYMGVSGTLSPLGDGILFYSSKIKLSVVHDGSSNTLLVGERPPSPELGYGRWYGGWAQVQNGHASSFLGVEDINPNRLNGCRIEPYKFGPGSPNNPCDTFHFWSLHSGGANFLLADGSVRFIDYSAEPLMSALATRAGRDVAMLD